MEGNVDFDFKQSAKKVNNTERKKTARKVFFWALGIVIFIILLTSSMITVNEAEQAVIIQFGQVKEIIVSPGNDFVNTNQDLMDKANMGGVARTEGKGLFLRAPFITEVRKYGSKLFTYVSRNQLVNTAEKKQYNISMFAQWHIANPGLFYIRQNTLERATKLLDNLIYPAIIQRVNKITAEELVSDKAKLNAMLAEGLSFLNNGEIKDSGIVIDDIQISSTMLPEGNLKSTYDKMIANREKVAQQLRSEGEETYQKAVADADREARITEANAIQKSELTKGEGDAEAMRIYAESYSVDKEFYSFWRSLKALEASLDGNTTLVLDRSHPLWKQIMDWIEPKVDISKAANTTPGTTP